MDADMDKKKMTRAVGLILIECKSTSTKCHHGEKLTQGRSEIDRNNHDGYHMVANYNLREIAAACVGFVLCFDRGRCLEWVLGLSPASRLSNC